MGEGILRRLATRLAVCVCGTVLPSTTMVRVTLAGCRPFSAPDGAAWADIGRCSTAFAKVLPNLFYAAQQRELDRLDDRRLAGSVAAVNDMDIGVLLIYGIGRQVELQLTNSRNAPAGQRQRLN